MASRADARARDSRQRCHHGLRKTWAPVHLAAATTSGVSLPPHLQANAKGWFGRQGLVLTATRAKQHHADYHEPPALPLDARDKAARVPDVRRLAKGAAFRNLRAAVSAIANLPYPQAATAAREPNEAVVRWLEQREAVTPTARSSTTAVTSDNALHVPSNAPSAHSTSTSNGL